MVKCLVFLTLSLLLVACNEKDVESIEHENADEVGNNGTYFTNHGYVEFISQAFGTVGIFYGRSKNLHGNIDFTSNTLSFSLDLNTLTTGIAQRDRDMHSVLETNRYPVAWFTGTFEPSFDLSSKAKQAVTASGQFTIHGVTHDLEISGFLQNVEGRVLLESEWILNVNDYHIKPPGLFLIKLFDEQDVRINAYLIPQLLATVP